MNPKQQIQQDLKAAMKSGDADRRQVLRMLMAAFKQVEVDTREELTDSDVMDVLMSEVKKHREAIADMEKAGRLDQIEEEQYALGVIETYLPQQISREEIEEQARAAIQEVGATTPRDMGAVMKVLMPRLKGQAEGKLVSAVVQELLS